MQARRLQAKQIRQDAAEIASLREHPTHVSNGEEFLYRRQVHTDDKTSKDNKPSHIANYTKGLPHDEETGLLLNSADYQQFVLGIQSGDTDDFAKTPLGPGELIGKSGCLSKEKITCETMNRDAIWKSQIAQKKEGKDKNKGADVRAWESAGAGLVFDLEGPDAQALTMPPAPTLNDPELAVEIAEVYLQALLRDVHFSQLRDQSDPAGVNADPACESVVNVDDAVRIFNRLLMRYRRFVGLNRNRLSPAKLRRFRSRVTPQNIFRGIAPGDDIGPYLSQFLLIGNTGIGNLGQDINGDDINTHSSSDGFISYGAIRVDQRVRVATPCKDYMTTFEAWCDVQNGADVRDTETYVTNISEKREFPGYRAITTPRDLATYVHFDALYEAYLNACLTLLGMGAPFDPGIPFQQPDTEDKQQGFAHFGGPQILTLVCEVATRALKAVRFQKFNVHRRLRPEALAGLIDSYKSGKAPDALAPIKALVGELERPAVDLLNLVKQHNEAQNADGVNEDRQNDDSRNSPRYLLPMAFPEGSPMHPSYGAGHATVAGACVTILKAFFDHGWQMSEKDSDDNSKYVAYEPNAKGDGLMKLLLDQPLTVEGELNKIAANISIGRDWAGVHYFTDYIESLKLGEQIAIGLLEEQKLTYGENFTMTVPLYEGGTVRI